MRHALVVVMLAGAVACGGAEATPGTRTGTGSALTVENGRTLNGRTLNGRTLNGRTLNGRTLNGRTLNGSALSDTLTSVELAPIVAPAGIILDASVQGTTLTGHAGPHTLSGADFVGAYLAGDLGNGGIVALKITAHDTTPGPDGDLDLYQVQWLDGRHGWRTICPDDDGNPQWATALPNRWDYSQGTATGGSKVHDNHRFTFACQEGAIYKCIEWGYAPWASAGDGTRLEDYHQTCTRLARADYCGDGFSYTEDGETINIYDNLGIQTDSESWVFEAKWSTAGATCLSPDVPRAQIACYGQKVSASCTADDPAAMLSSETPTGSRVPHGN